jgi:hypothetical protein
VGATRQPQVDARAGRRPGCAGPGRPAGPRGWRRAGPGKEGASADFANWAERARLKGKVGCCGGAGLEQEGFGEVVFSFIFLILFPLKTKKQFEFKSRFESKHPKTMHRHECNSKLLYFIN